MIGLLRKLKRKKPRFGLLALSLALFALFIVFLRLPLVSRRTGPSSIKDSLIGYEYAYVSYVHDVRMLPGAVATTMSLLYHSKADGYRFLVLTHRGTTRAVARAFVNMPVTTLEIPLEKLSVLCPLFSEAQRKAHNAGIVAPCNPLSNRKQWLTLETLMQLWFFASYALPFRCLVYVSPYTIAINGTIDYCSERKPFSNLKKGTQLRIRANGQLVAMWNPSRQSFMHILALAKDEGSFGAVLERLCKVALSAAQGPVDSGKNASAVGGSIYADCPRADFGSSCDLDQRMPLSSIAASGLSGCNTASFLPGPKPWMDYEGKLHFRQQSETPETGASKLEFYGPLQLEPLHMQFRRIWIEYLARYRRGRMDSESQVCLDLWQDVGYPKTCYSVYRDFAFGQPQEHEYRWKRKDLSIVTQLGVKKLERLFAMAGEWKGPISAALLLTRNEFKSVNRLLTQDKWQQIRRLQLHLVVLESADEPPYYPINFLRNVALQFCSTEYVFVVDVDFVVSPSNLYESLLGSHLQTLELAAFANKHAFVVPAFEYNSKLVRNVWPAGSQCHNCTVEPRSKAELVNLYANGQVQVFHAQFVRAHRPTNIEKYFSESFDGKPYYIDWSDHFEPYVILGMSSNKLVNPWFDERFVDRGRNKIVFATLLFIMGYKFAVLPPAFLLHSFEWSPIGGALLNNGSEVAFAHAPFFQNYAMHYSQYKQTYKAFYRCHGRTDCSKQTKTFPLYINS